MGWETLLKTIATERRSSLHPQMELETLPCKEETVYKPDPEMLLPSLGLSAFKI